MLADRADEVGGKLLMRIDVAADYADPADLLLAVLLLLLGLRLDVLEIVAVADRGSGAQDLAGRDRNFFCKLRRL